MTIWLKHPQHGAKDCYSESEALQDEKNGWERFDLNAKAAAAPAEVVDSPADEVAIAAIPPESSPDQKKRGRQFRT